MGELTVTQDLGRRRHRAWTLLAALVLAAGCGDGGDAGPGGPGAGHHRGADDHRGRGRQVVPGRGRRLFADATSVPRLHLAEARPFRSGIVLLRYRASGETA